MGWQADLAFLRRGHEGAGHMVFFPVVDVIKGNCFVGHLTYEGQRTAGLTPARRHRSHLIQLIEVDVLLLQVGGILIRIQLRKVLDLIVKRCETLAEQGCVREQALHEEVAGAGPTGGRFLVHGFGFGIR